MFDTFVRHLETLLDGHLPGQDAQFRMAPIDRRDNEAARIEGKPCREAAVLALFFPPASGFEPDEAHLLLTLRPAGLSHHAGQIAFPGGRREFEEDLVETALRETEEEVLIPKNRIQIVGTLTPLYVPPSNFCVHPFVGITSHTPDLTVTSDEVDQAFGVSLSQLLDHGLRRTALRTIRGQEREVPFFQFDDRSVWGATAMILSELATLLEDLANRG